MEKELRLRIILTLRESIKKIKNNNTQQLATLSDNLVHSSTITQSEYPIDVTTLIYSLSKLYIRDRYREFKSWNRFDKNTLNLLQDLIEYLERNNIKGFETSLQKYFKSINRLDPKLRHYIKEVIRDAKTAKASRLYEHGLSLGRTASTLKVSPHRLMQYIGKTGIHDMPYFTGDPKSRLELTRSLFK